MTSSKFSKVVSKSYEILETEMVNCTHEETLGNTHTQSPIEEIVIESESPRTEEAIRSIEFIAKMVLPKKRFCDYCNL